jgi:hypothetical protein
MLLALVGAAAATPDDCSINPLIVDDGPAGPKAQMVQDGYNCPAVVLEIRSNLALTIPVVKITAGSVLVQSANPADPSQNIQMVNNTAASELSITAIAGNITISGGDLKAHKVLKFTCTQQVPPCSFTADHSNLIAATDFSNPQAGGGLFFNIYGPINIQTTTIHGGDTLEMESVNSSITLICGGQAGCADPNIAKPQIVTSQCGNPIVFPCILTLQNAQQLTDVCIGAPEVSCNGGHKEKRFTAGTFIDFTGSKITSDEHVTFTCKGINFPAVPNSGDLMAHGAEFDMDSLVINCKGKIDLSDSKINMAAHLTVNAGTNCPVGTLCIDASGATINAQPIRMTARNNTSIIDACASTMTLVGTAFPILNGDNSPPYGNLTVDTAAECAPRAAATFCNNNGCVSN